MHDASHSYYDKRVIGITCIAQLPVPVEAVAFVWQRHLFLPSEAVQPDSTMKINSISASLAKLNSMFIQIIIFTYQSQHVL
jgi:hypothetical protein